MPSAPSSAPPRVVGTPLSHFTRKIRVLLLELGVDFEFVRAPGVLSTTTSSYGDNPLLRVPTLLHEGRTIIESDHIARYLVARFDPADRFGVRSEDVDDLNRLAVMNGVMANEVVPILARRGGLAGVDDVVYFQKLKRAIGEGLAWLEARVDVDDDGLDWRDIVLACMWQHLEHYAIVPLGDFERIRARVARLAARPSIASTTPAASLAAAEAAGWRPA